MKLLVTGSAGMLGADLVRELASDFEVTGFSRKPGTFSSSHYSEVHFDLTDFDRLRAEVIRFQPRYVFHAAAFTKVDLCESDEWKPIAKKVNADLAERLAQICKECGAHLIFFSTDYVFSGDKKEPYLETDPIQPINFYGQTKAWGERAVEESGSDYTIFRVTWLYGRHGAHFPGAILKQASEKKILKVVADQYGRPTWTLDLARELKYLLLTRQNLLYQYNKRTFHIGNDGVTHWADYARRVLDLSGWSAVGIQPITTDELNRPARRPANSVLDLSIARSCLQVQMRSWEDALSDFLKRV